MICKLEKVLRKNKNTIFWLLLSCSFVFIVYLFLGQSFRFRGRYQADLDLHIASGIKSGGSGYSLESTIVSLVYRIFGNSTAACNIVFSLILALFVIMTPLAVASLLSFLDKEESGPSLGVSRSRLIGLCSLFIGPIVIPYIWFWFNRFNYNINAWHNSTYLEMRLFSIITLCLYFFIQSEQRKGKNLQLSHWAAFTGSLWITTWFKPSFVVGFAPVMAIWILIDLLGSHGDMKKIKDQLLLGCAFIPSGIVVIIQYWKLFGSNDNVSVALNSEMNQTSDIIKILLFLLLPVTISLYNRKMLKSEFKKGNRVYVQTAVLWLFELLYSIIFVEIGRIGNNFGWGIRLANYFVVILYLRLFWINLLDLRQKKKEGQTITSLERCYFVGVSFVLFTEMFWGLIYFLVLLSGGSYWR